jgi:hypothetical protein
MSSSCQIRFAFGRAVGAREVSMGVGDFLRKMFSPPNALPPDGPRLSGASESALGSSLQNLPAGERGWITLAEAARLFSSEQSDYAFGEMDDAGKHRCSPQFMPVEGRVYFTRDI